MTIAIKLKLAALVAASCCITALIVKKGLDAGFPARYTLPFAVVVPLAVSLLLAHRMTAPLREMTTAARAMARGDYGRSVRVTSHDEVGELARAFTQMASELAEADRRRREFVANVSHELRTPISALHALLENVIDGITPARPEAMLTALDQTTRLNRLISQLLDLSRLDASADALDRRVFAAVPFLTEAITQAQIAHPAVQFVIDAADASRICGDRDRLHQVVANLLDNAATHSAAGGTVTIAAYPRASRGAVVLEVSDEGPGIPPDQRRHVFERFYRGSLPGADGGTGLGLAIARWAVELHGGDISVADAPRGCRVQVMIPFLPAAPVR
jgi:signal transduction histidine kinase